MKIAAVAVGLAVASVVHAGEPVGLDKLKAYAGSWQGEIHHVDTPFSKAGAESMALRNDCWRTDLYYVCEQIVGGEPKVLLVFTYDAKTDTYTSRPIPADGGPAGSGELRIQGSVWTFPWTGTDKQGKTVYFHVLNTWSSPDRIEFRQEYSTDNAHWTVMATGRETRVK